MKKCIVGLSLILASLAHAGGGSATVGTNTVKILGVPNQDYAPAWATGTVYSAGAVVTANSTRYFALTGGTSSTVAPIGITDVTDGTVTWRHQLRARRVGMAVVNSGTGTVYIWWSNDASTSLGIPLNTGDKLILTEADCPQTPVFAAADSEGNAVSIVEW